MAKTKRAPKANPVSWFEIPVNDIERANKFYQNVFGVEFHNEDMGDMKMRLFPWTEKGTGSAGGLVEGKGYVPSQKGTLVYFGVESIENTLKQIEENGGKTLLPKMSIGKYGFIAHFENSEGNKVALWSMT